MKILSWLIVASSLVASSSFQLGASGPKPELSLESSPKCNEISRAELIQNAALANVGGLVWGSLPNQAEARGRATLDQAYTKYTPRIIAGGEYFKKDLRAYVGKADWQGIKNSLQDPPKKTKEDRKKADGGTAERAAQAGGFSDARVLVACDLYAAAFSDSSISPKTKKMKASVEEMRSYIEEMNSAAKIALGEETAGGGFFGLGAKKPSKEELAKKIRDLYVKCGNSWNQYIFDANEGLPIQLQKLPYL